LSSGQFAKLDKIVHDIEASNNTFCAASHVPAIQHFAAVPERMWAPLRTNSDTFALRPTGPSPGPLRHYVPYHCTSARVGMCVHITAAHRFGWRINPDLRRHLEGYAPELYVRIPACPSASSPAPVELLCMSTCPPRWRGSSLLTPASCQKQPIRPVPGGLMTAPQYK